MNHMALPSLLYFTQFFEVIERQVQRFLGEEIRFVYMTHFPCSQSVDALVENVQLTFRWRVSVEDCPGWVLRISNRKYHSDRWPEKRESQCVSVMDVVIADLCRNGRNPSSREKPGKYLSRTRPRDIWLLIYLPSNGVSYKYSSTVLPLAQWPGPAIAGQRTISCTNVARGTIHNFVKAPAL